MTTRPPGTWLDKFVLTSFLLITVVLLVNATIDLLSPLLHPAGQPSKPLELRETFLHFAFLASQLCLIFYIWLRHNRHTQLEDELAEALKHAEAERAKAVMEQNRTEAVIAAIGDGISIQNRDFKIIYVNDNLKKIAGGDNTGSLCHQVYADSDTPCPGCPVDLAFKDGEVHKQEKPVKHINGPVTHIEITASPLRNSEGEIIAGIEVVRDITHRKQQEEALAMHANFLQRLIDTIPSPVFYKDISGQFLGCNIAYESLIGTTRENIIGKTVRDFLPAEQAEIFMQRDAELFNRPGTQLYETTVHFSDGSSREVFNSKATFNGPDGNIAGFVGIIYDITDMKKHEQDIMTLNQQLNATVKELEAFSFSLSHDLRNPLTRISMSAQELAENNSRHLDDSDLYFVRTILDAARQIEDLIEAMLKLGRVSRQDLIISALDLSSLAESICAELQMAETNREVEIIIAPGLTAKGDSQLLRVVLENLFSNAWKYSRNKEHARIEFGMTDTGQGAAFFVRDNGAGFEMSQADKLFKAFQRLHSNNLFPGTGIGLATVQRIIHRHGGLVWGEGEPEQGATFYFTLHQA